MTTVQRVRSLADPTVAGWYALDIAVAVALSGYAVLLTNGVIHTSHPHGGVVASIGVLAMTAPVAWRRRAPLSAAAVLAAGGLLNGVLFGSMVRCGATLPAVFLVAYALGARRDQTRSGLGFGLCAANVVTQAIFDPQLGPPVIVVMVPLAYGFFAFGRVVRSWSLAVDALQQQTAELRRQREHTARLSVAADRVRLSGELDGLLRDRIERIESVAASGRAALLVDPATANEFLATIESEGREVLRQMRDLVGALDATPPSEPQPSLAELSALLARSTSATTRLTIDGHVRRLPAGLELSGYRIVEHLLSALADAPNATIEVRLCFAPEAFEVHISGPAAGDTDFGAVLAAARERVALHSGSLVGRIQHGLCDATARLPLVSSHA